MFGRLLSVYHFRCSLLFPWLMHKSPNKETIRMKLVNNEDRISNMPDSILIHILSLTSIKMAVQTCVLSKRWRYMWRYLSNLDFDYRNFPFSCPEHPDAHFWSTDADNCNIDCKKPFFINFVNNFLSNRDRFVNVSILRLSSNINITLGLVQHCLNYAIAHNVQQLDLSAYFTFRKSFEFPPGFFTCQSLTVLKLQDILPGFRIPKPFCLPYLKTLCLDSFKFVDENNSYSFDANPFLGFPKLESLTLRNCKVANLIINSPTLRVLDIIFRGYYRPMNSSQSNIVISTPRLAVFRFEGQVSLDCSMDGVPCLETLYVDLWTCFEEPYTDEVKKVMPLNLFKLLGHLKNAKFVTLSMNTVEVLALDQDALENQRPPFCNLEKLKFVTRRPQVLNREKTTPTNLPCNVMTYLTQGSPLRDTLVVELPKE